MPITSGAGMQNPDQSRKQRNDWHKGALAIVSNIDIFNKFAAAFESAVEDDDWPRLAEFLAENVTYLNVGGPDPRIEGRDAVIGFLKEDVSNNDKRFDTRTLVALTRPEAEGDRLSRLWRCTYTLEGAPDLVFEGEARYRFENNLITEIEEELTRESNKNLEEWMQEYGQRLRF